MSGHFCPVCRRPVTRTPHHRIGGHYDTAHQVCPGSYESFDIAISAADAGEERGR